MSQNASQQADARKKTQNRSFPRAFRVARPSPHFDLQLLASKLWDKNFLLFKPLTLWLCYNNPRKLTQWPKVMLSSKAVLQHRYSLRGNLSNYKQNSFKILNVAQYQEGQTKQHNTRPNQAPSQLTNLESEWGAFTTLVRMDNSERVILKCEVFSTFFWRKSCHSL